MSTPDQSADASIRDLKTIQPGTDTIGLTPSIDRSPPKTVDADAGDNLWRVVVSNEARNSGEEFIGDSPQMQDIFRKIQRVAPLDLTVTIQGASGTGKELAARALHEWSGRRGDFVAVNCGAVAADLLPSVLFGHERGSFTGATKEHHGLFEQAQHGTLFLDEITEMPSSLQAHLLRALESGVIRRVGGKGEVKIDCRVVAATNRDSRRAVREGLLREDLYYRLTDFVLQMPLLRDRPSDITSLAQLFVDRFNGRYATSHRLALNAVTRLREYAWPGNVRELRQVIQRACLMCDEKADAIDIEIPTQAVRDHDDRSGVYFRVGMTFAEIERRMLEETMAYFGNDKTRTASALGISLKTIYNRLAKHSLSGREVHPVVGQTDADDAVCAV